MSITPAAQIPLPLARYRFHCVALSDIHLPAYSGSAWRGLFGHALRRTVCVTHKKDCKACLLWRNCVYSYIFETPPPLTTQVMRKYTAAPHPFVIDPALDQQEELAVDTPLYLDLVLVGKANQHLAYIIHAMQQAGQRGIGRQRGQFALLSVAQDAGLQTGGEPVWQTVYEADGELAALPAVIPDIPVMPEGELALRFVTPFRANLQGKPIKPEHFRLQFLLSSLLRRLSLLCYFHADHVLELDFKGLTAQAKQVELVANDLYWHHWVRYSSRQRHKVSMGGVMGEVRFAAADIAPFWELLYLGQVLHAGKGTVMGLGRFAVDSVS